MTRLPIVPVVLILFPPCPDCSEVHDGAIAVKDKRLNLSVSLALRNHADPAAIVLAGSEMAAQMDQLMGRRTWHDQG